MASQFKTVGVVGVGAMGSVFVELFAAAGAKVYIYDVVPESIERAKALGGIPCETPAALAKECDIVDVMVWNDEQAINVCTGENGILETLRAGAPLLLHSSIQPHTTRAVAEAAAQKGVPVADACIASIPFMLRNRDAAALFGGDEALFEHVKSHLSILCQDVYYMGALGEGNVAKGAYNTLSITPTLLVRECMEIMMAAGITFERARTMCQRAYGGRALGFDTVEQMRSYYDSGVAGNLFDPILPITLKAADDFDVKAPMVRTLAAVDKPFE